MRRLAETARAGIAHEPALVQEADEVARNHGHRRDGRQRRRSQSQSKVIKYVFPMVTAHPNILPIPLLTYSNFKFQI